MPLDRDKVVNKLTELGALSACHRCGGKSFLVIDEYSSFSLHKDFDGVRIGGDVVPVVLVGCTKCGAITPHALGALGLLPKNLEEKAENNDKKSTPST